MTKVGFKKGSLYPYKFHVFEILNWLCIYMDSDYLSSFGKIKLYYIHFCFVHLMCHWHLA